MDNYGLDYNTITKKVLIKLYYRQNKPDQELFFEGYEAAFAYMGLYNELEQKIAKMKTKSQTSTQTEKVFSLIQKEIDDLDRLIENQNEILEHSDTKSAKAKNDLLYKKKAYQELFHKLQGAI